MYSYFKLDGSYKLNKKILLSLLIFFLILLICHGIKYNAELNLNGIFTINSKLNESLYFSAQNGTLILETKKREFDIIQNSLNNYNFISRRLNKYIGIENGQKEEICLYGRNYSNNSILISWKITNLGNDEYIIQSNYNKKYLKSINDSLILDNIEFISICNKNIDKSYKFRIIKLFETISNLSEKDLFYIEKEPIDVLIKYIDLTDRSLKREGIKQIYKDQDNEELRYSLRSILENIPWVRKIFILMPNEKVRFLKPYEEIKEKIIYVKDKDLLGFESANIHTFHFFLYKMEKFGISKNFIYMDDDYFIGKPLKKSDFFYYDDKKKKVFPFLLSSSFSEIDKNNCINSHDELMKRRGEFKPQDRNEWSLSFLNSEKYFFEKYNITLISSHYTHNAIPENIDDLKDIFLSVQNYEYINETLFSLTRSPLGLNMIHYYNLFQLNINHRKVHCIPYKYIEMEEVELDKLDTPLFVINTCGNNIPSKKEYENQKKVMAAKFPNPSKYEIISDAR